MLGHPEQWQAFIKWLWNYGNDRLIRQAAIEARRNGKKASQHNVRTTDSSLRLASRYRSKPQSCSDLSRGNPSRKGPTQKHPSELALHRSLRSRTFKAQASKSKGKMKPSDLGLASLTLADIEGQAGGDQTLREKDPNGRIATVSPTGFAANDVAGLKTAGGDVHMAGGE